jgi:N-acetylmuramoyl-L-alanine amidase
VKEFQITQSAPSVVKISMLFKDGYNSSSLKLGNINNNLVITLKTIPPYNMNYYINTYRETSENSKDYKEDLLITTREIEKQSIPVGNVKSSNQMNEINQAFVSSNYSSNETYGAYKITDLSQDNNLRSKYYLNGVSIKDNLFVLNGVGTLGLEKPFMLENPLRMIFDLPNTTISKQLHNKEFALANGDKLKVAQFNKDTARAVVTSSNSAQYIPVFSSDSQTLMITNPQNLLTTHLPSYKTNIVKTNYQKAGKVDNLIFEFDKPLTYSLKRTSENLYAYFLNAEKYNDVNFQSAIKNTPYLKTTMHLMKNSGIRLTMPVAQKENICAYLSPDGKVFKISSSQVQQEETKEKTEQSTFQKLKKKEGVITSAPVYNNKNTLNIIVIDAGHGGKDCGAIRDNIFEKDITLDVSDRLQEILQKKGYKVYMTRTNDTYVSLEDRTIFTGNINPSLFVSVHVNSCNAESPKGIETHYYHENSIELANCVHTKLTKKISHTPNRGLLKSRFYVINHTTVPAILVEIGFISNTQERNELVSPQRKQATAEGIAEGIIEYLNSKK